MRKLGQGHGDGHPLMPQHGAEPSLSPAAGTSSAAACIAFDVHHQPLRFHTKATKELRLGSGRGSALAVCLCTRPYQIKTSTCCNCKISQFLTDCTRGTAQPAHRDVEPDVSADEPSSALNTETNMKSSPRNHEKKCEILPESLVD